MGITTEFKGKFIFDRPLDQNHLAYLNAFNKTRRLKWIESVLQDRPDPIRKAVDLPIGPEGAYYVGGEIIPFWEGIDPAVDDYNNPPKGQPGLWCLWGPIDHGNALGWDGGDKFYWYAEWIQYLIDHFIQPWGYKITGKVSWESEVLYHWSEEHKEETPCISKGEIIILENVIDVKEEIIWFPDG